jgi:ligand-binding sensor domain-containing protein/two-component sensor histidine kinase
LTRKYSLLVGLLLSVQCLMALDSPSPFTQYAKTTWTLTPGLHETVSAIAQTSDGYLWAGTREGLLRFDGYEFVSYTKADGSLPGNAVLTMMPGRDGTLWIGTSEGLASYKEGAFRIYGPADGIPNGAIGSVAEDSDGSVWIVAVGTLVHLTNGKGHAIPEDRLGCVKSPRRVYVDYENNLWVAGVGGVSRRSRDGFESVLGAQELGDTLVLTLRNTQFGLWLGTATGLLRYGKDHTVRRYTTKDGLTGDHIHALMQDRDGRLWVGTFGGLSKFDGERFASPPGNPFTGETIWSLFEDRERNLWVGVRDTLYRRRDNLFTTLGKTEGLPSHAPMAVHEDRQGDLWVGYLDSGVVRLHNGALQTFTTRDGLPSNEIYGIQDGVDGELLAFGAGGLSRIRQGRITNYTIPDPAGRASVSDAVVDSRGQLWAAVPTGVYRHLNGSWVPAIPSGNDPLHVALALAEAPDHSMWAGMFLGGLWRIDGEKTRRFTTADGLASNQIRSLRWDEEGTLWIAAFDGGLTRYKDGVFHRFRASDGLLSDNVADVVDDLEGYLWLSTTKGICRISKRDLDDFAAGRIKKLSTSNYGVAHGLRSAQMTQNYPDGGGGTRTTDGRLWFISANGLAVVNPAIDLPSRSSSFVEPVTHIVGVAVDGHPLTSSTVEAGARRLEFRYVGLHFRAPDSVQYSYRLEGLDPDWISSQGDREVSYNNIPPGSYRFLARSVEPSGLSSEAAFGFTVLPHFYETTWFLGVMSLVVAASLYGAYHLRLAQVRARYNIVLTERARMGRELHDTLSQGFVGISHQLEVLSGQLPPDSPEAREHLDIARRMARHSLTEAQRSVMDLRMSELEGHDLAQALSRAAPRWVAGYDVDIGLDLGNIRGHLTEDVEHNLFRIAQEAVANVVKHARAKSIAVMLREDEEAIQLTVADDGAGFDTSRSFASRTGHFGIIGMRERAERLGGRFRLVSEPGSGTRIEVRVPGARKKTIQN